MEHHREGASIGRPPLVKVSKLHTLTNKFESIKMEEHETFGAFHAKLMDIVNSSFNLGNLSLTQKQ